MTVFAHEHCNQHVHARKYAQDVVFSYLLFWYGLATSM